MRRGRSAGPVKTSPQPSASGTSGGSRNLRKRGRSREPDGSGQTPEKRTKGETIIRLLRERDVDTVSEIMNQLFTAEELISKEEISKIIKQNSSYGAIDGTSNEIMGFILVQKMASRRELYIEHLGVRNEYQRRGIGESLIKHVKGLINKNYTIVTLKVNIQKQNLIRFYQRLGFENDNDARNGYGYYSYIAEEDSPPRRRKAKATPRHRK